MMCCAVCFGPIIRKKERIPNRKCVLFMVDVNGLEPLTPCTSSKCSTS